MLANAGVPVELIDGYISSISVSVPWKALLNDSCEIEIHGLSLTFTPKYKISGNYSKILLFLIYLFNVSKFMNGICDLPAVELVLYYVFTFSQIFFESNGRQQYYGQFWFKL